MGIRFFAFLVSAMVIAVVIVGLFLIGSPLKERQHRFDNLRVNDMKNISHAIDQYYKQKNQLPTTLNDLLKPDVARFYYLDTITDPESSKNYDYHITNETSYQLCATFSLPTPTSPHLIYVNRSEIAWKHSSGKQCFELTVRQ